jgi:hypothetical protein
MPGHPRRQIGGLRETWMTGSKPGMTTRCRLAEIADAEFRSFRKSGGAGRDDLRHSAP